MTEIQQRRECPQCHMVNAPDKIKCDCGFIFDITAWMNRPRKQTDTPKNVTKNINTTTNQMAPENEFSQLISSALSKKLEEITPSVNRIIPNKLQRKENRESILYNNYIIKYWVILFVIMFFIIAVLILLTVTNTLRSLDLFGNIMLFSMLMTPPIIIGLVYAFPNQMIKIDKDNNDLIFEKRILTIPTKSVSYKAGQISDIEKVIISVDVEKDCEISGKSTLLGLAALATLGIGWVGFKIKYKQVPIYGIILRKNDKQAELIMLNWNEEVIDQLVTDFIQYVSKK